MNRILVYPDFDALYYSFYMYGIWDLFGEPNIQFSQQSFPAISPQCLAFIVKGKKDIRVVVDAYDAARIIDAAMEWCDVYGKVNPDLSRIPEKYLHKYLAIGPSFGIQIWPRNKAWWIALRNYRLTLLRTNSTRDHFANYRRQYKYVLPLESYVPGQVKDNYVFFLSSIWNENQIPGTNEHRASFIEACKSLEGVTFEGGFAPPSEAWQEIARISSYITSKRVPHNEWLEKTKYSAVVFNTPAVWECHGWRLAQYLALGKAIISTPLSRELPAPLVHGREIHYVDGSPTSIHDALKTILADHRYRERLEQNAHNYYVNFLCPTRIIQRLVDHSAK